MKLVLLEKYCQNRLYFVFLEQNHSLTEFLEQETSKNQLNVSVFVQNFQTSMNKMYLSIIT